MTVRGWLRRPSSVALLGSVAVAAVGMFNLAWYVPTSAEPIMSMSYALRYNNLVAWAALFAACAVAHVGGRMRLSERIASGDGAVEALDAADPAVAGPVPRADVFILVTVTAVAFAGFAWSTFGVPTFDNIFFFDRLAQALGGALPWRDFYFPYGPLMLYVPVALAWLSARLGAPAVLGYYIALGGSHVVGVPLLAWVVGRLPLAPARRRALFWIVGSSALLGVFGGLNYTLLRFLAPVASVLLLAGWAARDRRPSPLALGSVSLALTILNLALSPEMGVAFAAASLGLLVATGEPRGARRYMAPAIQLGGLAVLVATVGGTVSNALASIAGGAYRLPVLPSPYVLLFTGTALFVSFALGGEKRPFAGRAPLAAVFIAGLALAPSTLGRADFGHVMWNGLPVMFAGAAFVGRLPGKRFLAWASALALVFPVWCGVNVYISAGALFDAAVAAGQLPRGALVALGRVVAPDATDVGRAYDEHRAARIEGATRERLMRLDRVAMPFGAADTLGFEFAARGKLVPVLSDENGPVDDAQLEVVVAQLRRAERLVIPIGVANTVGKRVLAGDVPLSRMPPYRGRYASVVLQFPVDMRVRRKPYEGRYALGVEIDRTFEPVEVVGRYVVLERKR